MINIIFTYELRDQREKVPEEEQFSAGTEESVE